MSNKEYKYSDSKDLESYAVWTLPENVEQLIEEKNFNTLTKEFANVYKTADVPAEEIEKEKRHDFVIVGMNPGDTIDTHDKNVKYLNFHGIKNSGTYRLAAAIYDTELWGAYMTDLSRKISSKGSEIEITDEDVDDFLERIEIANIDSDATIIALGISTYEAFENYKESKKENGVRHSQIGKHHIYYLPHYSMSNGHWNTEKVHNRVLEILENHKK
ncbi:hypothetical protein [Floricoccus penangensis]|uniref:hypothetical protein n=1 Tax=Floricoccus penangensis TaxID=1859475 RepID=UPI00203A4105|nr:hypothetical protein [Floricoccus penangensis]URZ86883.1 hypothetical protein KIW23_07275 [Floricoccus penangensis]